MIHDTMPTNTADLVRWATWNELTAQPDVWRKAAAALAPRLEPIRRWVAGLDIDQVWFCGAGTSAYIGEICVAALPTAGSFRFRAVASTDLVSTPRRFLDSKARPLVVSFGRSGESTETIGTLDLLDRLAPTAPRLNITCNADSTLAKRIPAGTAHQHVIALPAETHDSGFAMTSSFSTMLLSALCVFSDAPSADLIADIDRFADSAEAILPAALRILEPLVLPDRVVFVGSGAAQYVAREAALKVMELTAGKIPALSESCLGFRHGPKSFMTPGTRVFVFQSGTEPASLYDADLVAELRRQYGAGAITTIGPAGCDLVLPDVGIAQPLLQVLPAQIAAVLWSDRLGLAVDDPFEAAGTLSRVVSHVTLHVDRG